jgi:arginyl-tRNA synthetase
MDINSVLTRFIYTSIKNAFQEVVMGIDDIMLEVPKAAQHGDISTNIAMKLTKALNAPAMPTAEAIVCRMQKELVNTPLSGKILKISVKEPGFINFFFTNFALYDVLNSIRSKGPRYGSCNLGNRRRVQIEFVSANPTGPLSVAHGRQAAVGDTLANILEFAGYRPTREYFINDEGRQMDMLGESVRLRYLELLGEKTEFPQDGYQGRYIYDIAQTVIDKYGKRYAEPSIKASAFFRDYSCNFIMDIIKGELKDFGVHFDVWTSQAKIARAKRIQDALRLLDKKGFLYKADGALWFKSTTLGDDKDRVVVKSDGSFTYLAPDIAYHQDKFRRGFDRIVNIWGPDHHGYIPRLTAAVIALGHPKDALSVLIVQLATLYRGAQQIPMSTRSGEFITLREVMTDTGIDAARFFFVARKISSHLDFDIDLAKKQSQENPVYYVQYAHARICNIIEFAAKEKRDKNLLKKTANLSLLQEPQELGLLKMAGQFPTVIMSCARALEPCGLVSYLMSLADGFHSFYDSHRVVAEDIELTKARLALVDSVRIVLASALKLLGVSAPTKM